MSMNVEDLGTFTLESRRLLLSDPCYRVGNRVIVQLHAQPGIWIVQLTPKLMLEVFHEDYAHVKTKRHRMRLCVDSGQLGAFDAKYYQTKEEIADIPAKEHSSPIARDTWFEHRIQYDQLLLPHGVWSSTYWGDGSYPFFVGRHPNPTGKQRRVVRVQIVFDEGEF